VVALLGTNPASGRPRGLLVEDAEIVAQEEVLGVDRHVGLELALPVPGLMLQVEEVLDGALERRRGRAAGGAELGCCGHAAATSATFGLSGERRRRGRASTASAAARPLRTAPSIVAGQPVSVQAPASASPGSAVRAPGRSGRVPGAARNVARGSRVTYASTTAACCAAGRRSARPAVIAPTSSSRVRPMCSVAL